LGHGDGTFADEVRYGLGWGDPHSVAVGDLDGDGHPDLTVANRGYGQSFVGGVSVLLNNGDGTFADRLHYGAGVASQSVAVGDLNADGHQDLAVANAVSDDVSVLLNLCAAEPCPWDLDGNGVVNVLDVLLVVANMGPCDGCPEDVNGDGVVNGRDVAAVATHFGPCP
jgi:hypothetical protein